LIFTWFAIGMEWGDVWGALLMDTTTATYVLLPLIHFIWFTSQAAF